MNDYTFYNVKVGNSIYSIRMNGYYLLTYEYQVLSKNVSVYHQHGIFGGKKITRIDFTLRLMKYCNRLCETKYPITITVENNYVKYSDQESWFCSKKQMHKNILRIKDIFSSNLKKLSDLLNN